MRRKKKTSINDVYKKMLSTSFDSHDTLSNRESFNDYETSIDMKVIDKWRNITNNSCL